MGVRTILTRWQEELNDRQRSPAKTQFSKLLDLLEEGGGTPYRTARAPAVAAEPPRERTAFNVAIENPLIIVHGDTATSQVIFTDYRQEKVGDPMNVTTQGKEYATWVKVNGQWLYRILQVASGSNPPEGWKE